MGRRDESKLQFSRCPPPNNPVESAAYTYDARWRLATRAITHASAPGATIGYIHDIRDHIIAETNGGTQREYIWLDDLPVAVVDQVATAPVIYYVHTDHLFRPVAMTDAAQNIAWSVSYKPFGEVAAIAVQNTTLDLRFPGQWFQLETGLHYNWHRHYDPTTGRYLQPDPWGFVNGPSVYNYVGGSPLVWTDRKGLGPFGYGIGSFIGGTIAGAISIETGPGDVLLTLLGGEIGGQIGSAVEDFIQDTTGGGKRCGAKKRSPHRYCQNVLCGAPTGDITPPLCPDCATKLLNGTPTLLENGTLIPGGINLFPDKEESP